MSRTRVKLCDRFLAALLSIMMIVAMIPVTTLQAFAATDEYPNSYTVTVTDGENAIEGAQVTVASSTWEVELNLQGTTDANGVASFESNAIAEAMQLLDGSSFPATVTVTKDGYEEASQSATIWKNDTAANVDVTMSVATVEQATVSVTVTGDATVEVNGAVQNSATVDVGTEVPVKITPAAGSYIKTLTVGSETVSVTKGEAYETTIKADADTAVVATVVKEITVSANVGEGGSVLLDDADVASKTVDAGSSVKITAKAAEGYQIASMNVGGAILANAYGQTEFSISPICGRDVEVVVTFVKVYTVTVTHNENGSIEIVEPTTVGGTVTVENGTNVKIEATPEENYRVSEVTINDTKDDTVTGANNSGYEKTLTADKDYTVVVTFAPNTFAITKGQTENGSIVLGAESVDYNGSCAVTVTPDAGYSVIAVKVNDTEISTYETENGSVKFTIENITDAKNVEATFAATEKSDVDVKDLFNDDATVYTNGMTFVYANDGSAVFTTDKEGIILYNKNGQVIGGGKDVQSATVNVTTEIAKIELVYTADTEMAVMAHEVEGVSADSILKIVVDKDATESKLTPEDANANGFYNGDVKVDILVNEAIEGKDAYSGIKTIDYKILTDNVETKSDNLYTFDVEKPKYSDLMNSWNGSITVDAAGNNSCSVKIVVTVIDNAGNESICTKDLDIDVTKPTIDISFNDEANMDVDGRGYFGAKRVATVKITERTHHFDPVAATNGIAITAIDKAGSQVANAYEISNWTTVEGATPDEAVHTATITFKEDANYTWSISYTDMADNACETPTTGSSVTPYTFTVDTTAPTGTVTVNENTWDKLLNVLTFGIFSRVKADVSATYNDVTSPVTVEYIKVTNNDAPILLSKDALDDLYKAGKFSAYGDFSVTSDEQFVVYIRITDHAGNYTYINSDGAIVDMVPSDIVITPEDANANGLYGHAYDDGIKVDISVTDAEPYSGIKSVDYKVVKDNDSDNPTQSGNLYTFNNPAPAQSDLDDSWTGCITVDPDLNNSCNVVVYVTVVDNAGNTSTNSKAIDIDVTDPTIDISFTDDVEVNKIVDNRGYFAGKRVATVKITERTHHFDAIAATNGIVINAVDAKGDSVANAYEISSWTTTEGATPDEAVHTATITFKEDANYTWSISYTDMADNACETPTTGSSVTPYTFTVDTTAPTGTVTVNENTWDKLLNVLTFGIFSRVKADVSATYNDVTSPVTVEYIKVTNNDAPILLSKDALDDLYKAGKFSAYGDFSVTSDEQFVVYIRITDHAGNYTYINSDGAIVDMVPSDIVITPEDANANGLYGHAYDDGIKVDISVTDAEPYSGIKSVDYKVVKDNDSDNPTQSGNLYTFNNPAPAQSDLDDSWTGCITVDPDLNNSCNVVVYVTVVDNAGNTSTNSKAIDIDVTDPTIDISFTDDVEVNKIVDNRGYFAGKRVATVKITERTHHFDAIAATNGIVINAVDAKGDSVANAYEISSWTTTEGATPDEAVHTATITFKEDANYTWSISYADKADNQNETPTTGESVTPYTFTVDTKAPTGTVTAKTAENRVETWDALRGTLTFGIWSKENITVTGTSDDVTSDPTGNIVEYYKVVATSATDGTTALTKAELDAVTTWEAFTSLKVEKDEQFTVYIKITDLAGNYTYIGTNGLIVDHNAPLEETIAPEVTVEPEQPVNGLYNGDVKVDIKVVDPLVGGTYSGLKKIWYEVKNMGEVTQGGEDKPIYEFTETDPKQEDLLQTWTGSITVDSKLNNSNDVEIIVYAQDNSMNGSDKAVAIKIDITKPTILVSYDNNSADSDTFFKDDRTATVVVTERNFDPKDVVVTITNTDKVVPVISEFTKTSEGTGNKDDAQWTATIKYTADGDYTFDIAYTDLAMNVCDGETFAEGTVASNEFTIDHTIPVIAVSYDNNSAQNGNYYKAVRTATVVITEHNFNADRVTITHTATDDGADTTKPTISGWTSNGDKHTATIYYGKDAKYTFDISVKDKAGNESADYTEETFFVDTTMPTLTITGVANNSANNGDVIPVVSYSDTNYDADKVTITLTGANRKGVELDGEYEDIHNGRTFTFKNFAEEKEIDDIYTLTATLTDKAGNTTTETITFSVNRFGSTYAMSESAEKLNGTYVQEPVDVVITETNANELKNIKITLFKNNETIVLTEGEDYRIDVVGGNGEWYHYTYTVFAKNFADDGVYRLTFHSEDAAGNVAENTLDTKETEVSFGVDATKPNIVVENLENGVTYALENMTVKMSISDNLLLSSITVYLDDYSKAYKTWTAEEISAIIAENGEFTFDIAGDSKSAHKVKIVCVDAAGNEQVAEITGFYVTTDIWVRYYNNKALFFGSIAGVIVLAGLIVFLVVYKRKKKEDK